MKSYSSITKTAAGALLVGALAACSGGSNPATDAVAPTSFTVAGTAATGAAFAGATVTLIDKAGAVFTADAVTAANGSYSITVPLSAKPPFVVLAVSADKSVSLVSVVSEAKTTTTNISPITNLIASRLSPSGDPTKLAGELKTGTASFDTAALAVKVAEIVALIQPLRDAAGDTSDPLNGKLVTDGTGADKVLDSLTITITPSSASAVNIVVTSKAQANATDVAVPITIIGGGTNAPIVQTVEVSGTPSVPAELALKPAASNCSALHSGTYRMVTPVFNGAPNLPITAAKLYGKIVIDAATLAITYTDGSTGTWTANGPCQFTDDGGKTDIVVSQASVIVTRYTNDNGVNYKIGIGFPDQTHTLAELAGNWNTIGLDSSSTPNTYVGTAASLTLDAAGKFSAANYCRNETSWDLTVCTTIPDGTLAISANSEGNFDFLEQGGVPDGRLFAYRSGGGALMLVEINLDSTFTLYTKQRTNTLPTVGTVSNSWSLFLDKALSATSRSISKGSNTILSVDAVAGSWVRTNKTQGGTDDHEETLYANKPRNGYTFRASGTSPATNSASTSKSISFGEFTNLSMRGMGFNALLLPGVNNRSLSFSVGQP